MAVEFAVREGSSVIGACLNGLAEFLARPRRTREREEHHGYGQQDKRAGRQ
jgi:hypothetical protein